MPRRSQSETGDPPTVACPMCEEDVAADELYTCDDCGRQGCSACVDLSYFCCQDCLAADDEDGEEDDWSGNAQ
jgi:hypothetical protein